MPDDNLTALLRSCATDSGADPFRRAGRASLPWDALSPAVLLLRAMGGGDAMKVYMDDDNGRRLVGQADVPEDCGLVYAIPMFGVASVITKRFTIGTVTHLPSGGGAPVVERAVLAAPGQLVELLPGWVPLAS